MKFTLLSFFAFLSFNFLVLISPTIAQTIEKEELVGEFSVVVEDIRVEGLQRIEPGTVFSLIDIELDEVVDRKKVSEAIKVLFNSGFFEFDQNLIFILLDDSISLFEKTVNDIDLEIFLPDPIKAERLKLEVQNLNKNYFVYSWNDVNKSFFSALKVERNVMFIILTLIIVVAAFNIISGLTILIKNKTKEIAIIKTLGLSNKSIVKSFFLTGFSIGLFATITGVLIGTIFSIYIENIRQFLSSFFNLNIFPPDVYFLEQMPSEISILSIFIISIFSLFITAISSYFPARTISKLEPSQALKYE